MSKTTSDFSFSGDSVTCIGPVEIDGETMMEPVYESVDISVQLKCLEMFSLLCW